MISLHDELKRSVVYSRACGTDQSSTIIDDFSEKLDSLENEAQDLAELQELMEANGVNFSLLTEYVVCFSSPLDHQNTFACQPEPMPLAWTFTQGALGQLQGGDVM